MQFLKLISNEDVCRIDTSIKVLNLLTVMAALMMSVPKIMKILKIILQ